MRVKAKIWIETDQGSLLLGEGRLEILRAVARTGSLSAAAREMDMSYRAVWGKVRTAEARLGLKLVHGVAGGPRHGGAVLTEVGKRIVEAFARFDAEAQQSIQRSAGELIAEISKLTEQASRGSKE